MFDLLREELVALDSRLEEVEVPMLIGGGMGLYLREKYLGGERSPRYPVRPESRPTEDLDVLLSAEVVDDSTKMNDLRDVLASMGYEEEVPYFQFIRTVEYGSRELPVKVDLLAAPPADDDADQVEISPPRIRPRDSEQIHAYLTEEAAGIEIEKVPIELPLQDKSHAGTVHVVHIPSSFNYLLLKLNAFHDRKDRTDAESDEGRHHAFDIFRVVTDMREDDWQTAERHVELDGDADYLKSAAKFQRQYFLDDTSLGVIRLKENEGYRRYRDEFDRYIPDVLDDLSALFAGIPG